MKDIKKISKNYLLWGTKAGAEKWDEQKIVDAPDMEKLKKGIERAKANGYENLRVHNLSYQELIEIQPYLKRGNVKAGKWWEGELFKHPQTGQMVDFKSLPLDMQKLLNERKRQR